jgi:hypothetical protein
MSDRLGYIVVTYNQASGWPQLDYPDLHQDLETAHAELEWKQQETAKIGRRETHEVCVVLPLEYDDA